MKENKVLATVNGKDITENDVEVFLQSLAPQVVAQFNNEEGKIKLLEELINQELFYLDAVNNDFDKEKEFMTEFELMKISLLKQYAITKVFKDIAPTDEEIQSYYEKYSHMFKNPESVKASHILVDDEELASNIYAEIENGLSFEEAAKKYSKCPSKEKGGDLGYFTKGQMVPEFERAAFDMKVNEISAPIKSQFGYHIILLVDRKEATTSTLDEIRDELSKQIIITKQNEAYKNKVTELTNKYDVAIKY